MEEANALAQQQLMLMQQQRQQQQQHHQLLILQQIQHQKQQQQAISHFPSNIDAHLRPSILHRPVNHQQLQSQSQSQLQTQPQPQTQSQGAQPQQSHPQSQHSPNANPNSNHPIPKQQNPNSNLLQQQPQPQKANRSPANQAELQMAYQDAWRVCHPDFKRHFSSLEDACERLLPYHVVADYEAEEDDRILDSDTTGQMLSRCQQWDHNIAAKVAEFTATFEKQVLAFNIIARKRAFGEFRSEERLMIEQVLLQEERRGLLEVRAEMDSRQKAGREAHEANLRMAAMVQAEQARAESQAHAEMIARAPIRANAFGGSQGSSIPIIHDIGEQEQEDNPNEEMINGWGNNPQRDEKEPSEDFLNDEETENGDSGGIGEFDLNTR